jgi:hypothetical protein
MGDAGGHSGEAFLLNSGAVASRECVGIFTVVVFAQQKFGCFC